MVRSNKFCCSVTMTC